MHLFGKLKNDSDKKTYFLNRDFLIFCIKKSIYRSINGFF
ncbi:hypothetical protein RC62_4474 [Flavobacterium aquidurense]|uniref:Uncharacterized protein n=1 Tax=Flavobacterium aquidurense TaxID=362413 RepID=A0A0Q0WXV1_9FLAO|nr:hypothetical protein RC62_4474 [Flavobacterium aquidurense]